MVQEQVDSRQVVRSRLPAGGVLAREIMTSPVITIGPDSSVFELAGLLSRRRISGVAVVDDQGHLLGMATEGDVISRAGDRVCEIMTANVSTATEDTPVEEIAAIFQQHGIKRVPVLRGRQPVGIVSRGDIVRAIGQAGLQRQP
jgi:CBS domain-containing protein